MTHWITNVSRRGASTNLAARVLLGDTPPVARHGGDGRVIGVNEVWIGVVLGSDEGHQARNGDGEDRDEHF